MVLAKPLYEPLPYAYLSAALAVFIAIDNPLAVISAALLYVAGSLVWIKRSTYRRDQRIKKARGHSHIKTKCPHRLLYLPEPVYECLPFAYLAAGIAAYSLIPGQTGFMLAAVAWFAGALVLILRSANRHRH